MYLSTQLSKRGTSIYFHNHLV